MIELLVLVLTTDEQHHCSSLLRSSSSSVIPVMLVSSNAEKPDAIHGWKQYKTQRGKQGGLVSGWSISRQNNSIVDREHEGKDYVDEAIKVSTIIVLGVHQPPREKDPRPGVWYWSLLLHWTYKLVRNGGVLLIALLLGWNQRPLQGSTFCWFPPAVRFSFWVRKYQRKFDHKLMVEYLQFLSLWHNEIFWRVDSSNFF